MATDTHRADPKIDVHRTLNLANFILTQGKFQHKNFLTKKEEIFIMSTEEKIQYILNRLPEAGEYEIDQVYEFLLETENET